MEARKASFVAPYAVSVGLLPTPGGRRASSGRDAWMRGPVRHCEPIDTPRSSSAVSSSQKSLTEGNPWLGSLLVPWGLDGVCSRG